MVHNKANCVTCKESTEIGHEHNVECLIETDSGTMACSLHNSALAECCLQIAKNSYEDYKKSIWSIVSHLRKLCQNGLFTLTVDNNVTEVRKL